MTTHVSAWSKAGSGSPRESATPIATEVVPPALAAPIEAAIVGKQYGSPCLPAVPGSPCVPGAAWL